jgi:hypothetical protein
MPLTADISEEDIVMREIDIHIIIIGDKLLFSDVAFWSTK